MKLEPGLAAVVTGGASGLGKASAQALAEAGFKVTIFDVNQDAGQAHARDIGGMFAHVDITSEESVVAGFEQARAAHGQERAVADRGPALHRRAAARGKRGERAGGRAQERTAVHLESHWRTPLAIVHRCCDSAMGRR